MIIFLYYVHSLSNLKEKLYTGDVHKNVLNEFVFRENRRSESHILFSGVIEFRSVLSTSVVQVR
jgi:hypothetical protein